jgi:lipopolysaccharide export system protein LptC
MSLSSYTRFVLFGKHALWVLAALLVMGLIWIANYNSGKNGARLVFTNLPQTEILQNLMINPRYQGLDARNQPYTVIADKATQIDEEHVALDNIRAEIAQHDGTWIALNAKTGSFGVNDKKLQLTGGVEVFSGNGYEMRTDHAYVDIGQGSAYGDAMIQGQGAVGTLQANNFKAEDRGQVIRFKGDVKVRVYRD